MARTRTSAAARSRWPVFRRVRPYSDCIRMSATVFVVIVGRVRPVFEKLRPVSCAGGRIRSCRWADRTNVKAMQK
jgi:hypothetical protein